MIAMEQLAAITTKYMLCRPLNRKGLLIGDWLEWNLACVDLSRFK